MVADPGTWLKIRVQGCGTGMRIRVQGCRSGYRVADPGTGLRIRVQGCGPGYRVADLGTGLRIRVHGCGHGYMVEDPGTGLRTRVQGCGSGYMVVNHGLQIRSGFVYSVQTESGLSGQTRKFRSDPDPVGHTRSGFGCSDQSQVRIFRLKLDTGLQVRSGSRYAYQDFRTDQDLQI